MKTWMNKSFILLISLFFSALALAAAPTVSPDELVAELSTKWQTQVVADEASIKSDPDVLYRLTDQITGPYIDYSKIARLILGQYWRQATDTQKTRFVKEFRDYLVRTYATAMYTFRDAKIDVRPTHMQAGADMARVKTVVDKAGQPPIALNFVLFKKGDEWQAMDVVIENVSVVATLRDYYRTEIQKKGLDQVIAELATKAKS